MSALAPLPIDPFLPEIVATLDRAGALVIQAEPGAGKTTRVPRAILDAHPEAEVWVLEPRRLAARLAARRVAAELGEPVGERVGYQVRFDDATGPRTRIRFVTEGILTRRMDALRPASTVILDEFHERHIDTDLALALLVRRRDVRIAVMSATLEVERVAAFLGAPVIRVPGRVFPVAIEYAPNVGVADAVSRAPRDGHVLVFLPGAGEIARAAAEIGPEAISLHGSLSPAEQDRALRPSERPKIILATNIAESSVTIEGVTTVIDSGLARVPSHSPWTGLSRLRLEPVSRASATQRAARAGRTAPGRCVRLYAKRDFEMRPAFAPPEIARLDLAEAVLTLRAAGVADLEEFRWFEPPPAAALRAAETLLRRIGAVDAAGRVTPVGERMRRFPLHPRLARVMVEAEARGAVDGAATVAAILEEGDARGAEDPDILTWRPDRATEEARRQIRRIARGRSDGGPDALLFAVLAGFPDRAGRRKGDEVVLADGQRVRFRGGRGEWLVVLDADETHGVRAASEIEPDWLVDLFPEEVRESVEVTWNAAAERVDVVSRLAFGVLVLDERRGGTAPEGAVEETLARAALAAGPEAFAGRDELRALLARLAFAGLPAPDLARALRSLCAGKRSFAELREAGLMSEILREIDRGALERLAPAHVTLPRGRRVPVRYEPGRPPYIASRLQDFFGAREGPRIGGGTVPLVLHLLAPNGRPVQVTTDLAGFWERHYPAVRRELRRRYPKHAWPEDPLAPA